MTDEEWLAKQNGTTDPDMEWLKAQSGNSSDSYGVTDALSDLAFAPLKAIGKAADYVSDLPIVQTIADAVETPVKAGVNMLSNLQKPADALAGAAVYGIQYANDYMQKNPDVVESLNNMREQTGGPKLDANQYDIKSPDPQGITHAMGDAWNNGVSYTEAMDQNFVKENPIKANVADFALKVVADPLNIVSPAGVVKFAGKGLNVAGDAIRTTQKGAKVLDSIGDAGRSFANKPMVQTAVAGVEDFIGKNRIKEEQQALEAAKASHAVDTAIDYLQPLKDIEKEYGKGASSKVVDYVEAMPKRAIATNADDVAKQFDFAFNNKSAEAPLDDIIAKIHGAIDDQYAKNATTEIRASLAHEILNDIPPNKEVKSVYEWLNRYPDAEGVLNLVGYDGFTSKPNVAQQLVKSLDDGTLFTKIKNGEFTKEQAFNALRDAGKEIPSELLQQHQIDAKLAGQAIPDYVYRDQVLESIENPTLRNAIQAVGDKLTSENKGISNALNASERLGDASWVHFADGEHLRRTMTKWQNPEKFLDDLAKHGTNEEYVRAFADLNKAKAGKISNATKVDVKDFVGRQELSSVTLKKLGMITDPQYRVMDTMNRSYKTLETDKFLNNVSAAWGKGVDEAAELSKSLPKARRYIQVPETKSYGSLAGKYVPQDILNQVMGVVGENKPSSEVAQTWQKMVSWWKVEKLAAPAPMFRNLWSVVPMANVYGQVPIAQMPKYLFKAGQAMKQGYKNKSYELAKRTGAMKMKGVNQELSNIIGEGGNFIQKGADKAMDAFGKPDELGRLVVMMYHTDHGKTWQEAAKLADRAMFNYSDAPPIINSLAKNGVVPFAKFPYFAAKETARNVYENPGSFNKWTRLTEQNDEDKSKVRPDYLNKKLLMPFGEETRMVNGKPQKISNNLDLSYSIPFMNGVNLGNPISDTLTLATTGRNGLNMQVIKPGMSASEKVRQYAKFARDSYGPSLTASYNEDKLKKAYTGEVDAKGRSYSPLSAGAEVFMGIKNVPINDQDAYNSKIKKVKLDLVSIKSEIRRIERSQEMTTEQKAREKQQLMINLQKVVQEGRESAQAWKRLKEKGR